MYWDLECVTHIEVPKDYWVCSHNVEWINEDGDFELYLGKVMEVNYNGK